MRSTWTLALMGVASLFVTSGNLAAGTELGVASPLATSANLAAGTQCRPPRDECDTAKFWVEGAGYQEGDRVITAQSNLYQCRGGAATALCDDPGYEPDKGGLALDAWEPLYRCSRADGFELQVAEIAVSDARQCKRGVVTLTATLVNDSPFSSYENAVKVAFYHSASKKLIAVEEIVVPDGVKVLHVSTVWKDAPPVVMDITVVADDDGTGCGIRLEYNDSDNFNAVRLPTCPIPKPGPL